MGCARQMQSNCHECQPCYLVSGLARARGAFMADLTVGSWPPEIRKKMGLARSEDAGTSPRVAKLERAVMTASSATPHARVILAGIGALTTGLLTVIVLSIGTDATMRATGVFPPVAEPTRGEIGGQACDGADQVANALSGAGVEGAVGQLDVCHQRGADDAGAWPVPLLAAASPKLTIHRIYDKYSV